MSIETITELRAWILLILALIGASITIKSFIDNIRQRKLENTYKTLDFLRKHITQKQIDTYVELFHANNPLGYPENEFHLKNGEIHKVEFMFAEGGCGQGDIHNMIEVFNLVSKSMGKGLLKEELIWYEYGQIMLTCYKWTSYLEENPDKLVDKTRQEDMTNKQYLDFLKFWKEQQNSMFRFFFDFNNYMKNHSTKIIINPTKFYTYLE